MAFPFVLARTILLSFIAIMNMILMILSALAFHQKTGGGFQVLTICFSIFNLSTIACCLYHQLANRGEEANNTRNLIMFGVCSLLGVALVVSLTIRAAEDHGAGLCHDFAHAAVPCVPAGVQLGMGFVSPVLASVGFIVSWIDKYPGAVKVMPRYPITKAPSSHFAAYGHDLDGSYTRPPIKASSRSRKNSEWSDVPI